MTVTAQKNARIYTRVSTESQDLERQERLIDEAKASGYYVAGVYSEKASGTTTDRPELQRMIHDLQPGDVVIAEKIDRLSRLPLPEAEKLVSSIKAKGARLAIPGVVDLSELADGADGIAKIVLDSVQSMLLKLALQMSRDDYETRRQRQREGIECAQQRLRDGHPDAKPFGRRADAKLHERIVALREGGNSIAMTAELADASSATVKRVMAAHKAKARVA
jgi:DNA invertase Pin-like site-specific DNA recombinase